MVSEKKPERYLQPTPSVDSFLRARQLKKGIKRTINKLLLKTGMVPFAGELAQKISTSH